MTSLGRGDADLHDERTGEHVGTARTANGRDVERHERRIRAHLEAHRAERSAAEHAPFSPTAAARLRDLDGGA